ncbi:MAG TPA: hypothetical protein DCY48_00875 [Candidatus Magasanikbacteria bacterium]|nr:MAG: hypothetical protein A3I74_02465 [Candidatus Magasanikbacteria bacterium RIFCSPLOWO2_02_FULL_47_16]OGH79628.1 MAG: hypothetical protein A3C10_00935 [Candidatus Magasanikbacteria bacterium RIFCSPHIGHO2_02_FULL_48_18]OGH82352.1 MAG: hypothetical protein A3G08_03235 [Candidatus Magasanikbacteria bacterium RIFCSPLOWO2_12_FULL_47_9b]HAZ28314.1 hypothetical protein [Candidatus Magasanikbacteria bacterium]
MDVSFCAQTIIPYVSPHNETYTQTKKKRKNSYTPKHKQNTNTQHISKKIYTINTAQQKEK